MESAPDTAAAVAPSTAGHSAPSTAGNLGRTPDDFASAFPFPADMKRAATQSPITTASPTGGRRRSSGFDPMTPSSADSPRRKLAFFDPQSRHAHLY